MRLSILFIIDLGLHFHDFTYIPLSMPFNTHFPTLMWYRDPVFITSICHENRLVGKTSSILAVIYVVLQFHCLSFLVFACFVVYMCLVYT